MTTASARKDVTEDPIVAIYPVPGELDDRELKDRLPPIPTRIDRERAKKAVATGAFSFEDATQTEESKAARQPAIDAAKADVVSKAELTKMIAAAVADANKASSDRIDELEKKLAEANKPAGGK